MSLRPAGDRLACRLAGLRRAMRVLRARYDAGTRAHQADRVADRRG
jgi:hypothetical protein